MLGGAGNSEWESMKDIEIRIAPQRKLERYAAG